MKKVFALICFVLSIQFILAGDCEQADKIQVIEVESFDYAAIEVTGSYDQHGAMFGKLYGAAGPQQVSMNQPPMAIYWNSPMDSEEDSLVWEVGLVIPKETEVQSPLKKKTWAFTPVVAMTYKGSFDEEMGLAIDELNAWISKNGYVSDGPMLDKFIGQSTTDEDGNMSGQVEIWIPVKKAE